MNELRKYQLFSTPQEHSSEEEEKKKLTASSNVTDYV
jgi:hypothetical protein